MKLAFVISVIFFQVTKPQSVWYIAPRSTYFIYNKYFCFFIFRRKMDWPRFEIILIYTAAAYYMLHITIFWYEKLDTCFYIRTFSHFSYSGRTWKIINSTYIYHIIYGKPRFGLSIYMSVKKPGFTYRYSYVVIYSYVGLPAQNPEFTILLPYSVGHIPYTVETYKL